LRRIAVVRPDDLAGSNAAKAAGHLRAASEHQSQKNPMPVSGRWRGPANDPLLSFGAAPLMSATQPLLSFVRCGSLSTPHVSFPGLSGNTVRW
jgi:hypothetical protein